ncbi:ABC transporter ATP-binding protein/permease [Flavobacteriaceae bacterium]|nr:ABC transporter ATP-binding protein/permease [Flavobacteriaceae bacterium]MDB4773252.1 ABC transporter ATP-binding protein/permease [Flavobacteriaceae bacterium]
MNYFKKILLFALPYKRFAFLNILFNILYALFSALSFVALVPMFDVLFGSTPKIESKPTYTGISDLKEYVTDYINYKIGTTVDEEPLTALIFAIVLILILFFLKNLFNYLAMYFVTFLRNGILKDLRDALYVKILQQPVSYFTEKKKGDMLARITSDVLEIQHSFLSIIELIVREPLTIIFTLILMFNMNVKLSVFVLIFIPVSGFIISSIGKSLKKHSQNVQKEQGEFLSIVEESLSGLSIIKAFSAEGKFNTKFFNSTLKFFNFSNKLLNRQNLASPVSEFMGIGVIGGLLWFGGSMVLIEGTLRGTIFIAFMTLAYNILTPAKAISKASYAVKKGNAAAERVLEILEAKNELTDAAGAKTISDFSDKVNFKNINFKYETKPVLKNFSLELSKGQTIALVGQSGSGKTTVANLLNRFYDVEDGSIQIDGTDLKKITTKSLRKLIGIVTQDSILFNDSVLNNLLIGDPNANEEEVIAAAKIANAHEFIINLPDGYNTNIGDQGNKLSGGQKQRLSIARAVLKNPPIMVLDEATSALDTESEKLVQEALENLMNNRTSLVIAHRLSTIQKANLIVVMQAGEIIEMGTHSELIANNSNYKKLVEMQSL